MSTRYTRALFVFILLASLFCHMPAWSDSEAGSESGGVFDTGAVSEAGGVWGAGGHSESGGVLRTGAYSESGGVFNCGGSSESGGVFATGAGSESGGPLSTGAYSESGGANMPGVYRRFARYRSFVWRNGGGNAPGYLSASAYYRVPSPQHVPEVEVKNYSWPPDSGVATRIAGTTAIGSRTGSETGSPATTAVTGGVGSSAPLFPGRRRHPTLGYPVTYAALQSTKWLRSATFPSRRTGAGN